MTSERVSGILLHPTSLPGPFGIGDLGPEAYKFVDFLVSTGQSLWQLLQWAVKEEFSPEQVEAENKRLKNTYEAIQTHKTELETKLKASQETIVDIPELEEFIKHVQSRISDLDFEGKRQALDMLDVTIWLDGINVEITGIMEPSIVTIPSSQYFPLSSIGEGDTGGKVERE